MKKPYKLFLLFLGFLFSVGASAAGLHAPSGLAAGAFVGTEGAGLQLSTALIPSTLNLNFTASSFSKSDNFTRDGVNYNGDMTLGGEGLTLAWFPFHGGFNVFAGGWANRNKIDLTAQGNGGTYTINGTTYTSQQVGSLTGQTNFKSVAPYFGVGFGNVMDGGRLTFVSSFGAIYQGAPSVTLTATGAAANPQLASDVQAAQNQVNSKLDSLKWWPVINVGLAYRF